MLIYFFIAVGLSMDAFTMALAYGTSIGKVSKGLVLSYFVGIFHFFMSIVGSALGNGFQNIVSNSDKIVGIILLILAIQMYMTRNEEKKDLIFSFFTTVLFSFTVSIDSFSVGVGLGLSNTNIIYPAIIFSIVSFIITLFGLLLGKKLSDKLGLLATYIGIAILLILSLWYLL